MRTVQYTVRFNRDLKRLRHLADKQTLVDVNAVIALLANNSPLPHTLKDHPLRGSWAPARECHIRPDILLVYEKTKESLRLLRLASHSELF